jgi:hypothetical protein
MISWFKRKQGTVALSLVEAEYMAASSTCEAIWLLKLIVDLTNQMLEPMIVYYDN